MEATAEKENLQHAFDTYGSGIELRPQSLEIAFWDAFTLATNGCVPESLALFRKVFAKDKDWVLVLKRLLGADPVHDPSTLRTILAAAGAGESAAHGVAP
jgi:hypothetical protein